MNKETETCVSCHERPPAGYVKRAGHGVYLTTLCRRCWLRGDESEGKKVFQNFHNTKGRS
jgi:hypothetical protein